MKPHSGTDAAPADELVVMARRLLAAIPDELTRIKQNVQHVVSCVDTHRRHTIGWRAMKPARQMLQSRDMLPPNLWISAAGGYFLDALDISVELDLDVQVQYRRLGEIKALLEFVNQMPVPDAEKTPVSEHLQVVASLLESLGKDQLLGIYRTEAVDELHRLLVFNEAVYAEQEVLMLAVGVMINKHVVAANTDAGYYVVPDGKRMHPGDLIDRAEGCVKAVAAMLESKSPPNPRTAIERSERAGVVLNCNRALALAMLAVPDVVEKMALHGADSILLGRMSALAQSVLALQPSEDPSAVDVRDEQQQRRHRYACILKGQYERNCSEVAKRSGDFQRDERHSRSQYERLIEVVRAVAAQKEKLKSLHVYH